MEAFKKKRLQNQFIWAGAIIVIAIGIYFFYSKYGDIFPGTGWKLHAPWMNLWRVITVAFLFYYVLSICPRNFTNQFITKLAKQYNLSAADLVNIGDLDKGDIQYRDRTASFVIKQSRKMLLMQALAQKSYL